MFIDNFYNEKVCIYWGWYLAADFQMFIIALLILYTFNKNKKIGKFFNLAYISIFTLINLSLLYDLIRLEIA